MPKITFEGPTAEKIEALREAMHCRTCKEVLVQLIWQYGDAMLGKWATPVVPVPHVLQSTPRTSPQPVSTEDNLLDMM